MKKIISFILAAVLALPLSACNGNNAAENDKEENTQENGIINLQMRDPDILDPIKTEKKSVRSALLCVYEPLFNITENFALENVLAETYAFNESATVMTLKIKEGVLWHNNHVFTADDVVYTVEKIKSNPKSSYYLNLEKLDRAEKQGDYEVVFYLKEPYSLFVYNLYFPIMHTGSEEESLMGTGPYRFSETDGKQLVLTKNTAWHMGGVDNDGVRFIYMKTSAMAQEAFSSGKIHAVTCDMIDAENFAIKESNKKYTYPDGLFEFVGFNNTAGLFKDAALRRAASNAIDRSLLSEVFEGVGAAFPVMQGSEAFSPIFESVNYGADYAMEIIFSSGWRDGDNDGTLKKAIDGEITELSVSLLVSDQDAKRVLAAEKIKEQLEAAGFGVKTEVVDITEYNTRVWGGEFDMFMGAVYYNSPYDMTELLSSSGKVNYMGYKDTQMDDALKLFLSSDNIDTSAVAFSKIQALYNDQQPIAALAFRTEYVLTNTAVEGEVAPFPYSPYANVSKWKLR